MKRYNNILARLGAQLPAGARILDFGCGTRRTFYRLLDQGYDAFGYDLKDYLDLRAPEDRPRFTIALSSGGASF